MDEHRLALTQRPGVLDLSQHIRCETGTLGVSCSFTFEIAAIGTAGVICRPGILLSTAIDSLAPEHRVAGQRFVSAAWHIGAHVPLRTAPGAGKFVAPAHGVGTDRTPSEIEIPPK